MTSLAGLHEQLDDLHSRWREVQQHARQSPGRHPPESSVQNEPEQNHCAAKERSKVIPRHCQSSYYVSPANFGALHTAAGAHIDPGHGLKAQSLQGTVQRPSQKTSSAKSMIQTQTSPQCIITPANAANRKPPQQLAHTLQKLSPAQAPASCALPRASPSSGAPRPKHIHADNAENDFLGHLHSPAIISPSRKPAQKGRKQKRPQWQDVSIDLSALQAAQEQAAVMDHNDVPVGPLLAADTAAAHMSGVCPASPSPPKQHALHPPGHPLKSQSSVPTLPALTLEAGNPPEALAAWHENVGLFQQQQNPQHLRPGCRQQHDAVRESLPYAEPLQLPQRRHPRQAQLPICLPPLHHQPFVRPPAPHIGAPAEMQLSTEEMHHRALPSPCLSDEADICLMSSSRHAVQALTDFAPAASCHAVENLDGFESASSHQVALEDPRSAQQVPMQYMRHPLGSGSPGGLHRLHRLLRPLARSQHPPANSCPAGTATHPSGAAHFSNKPPEHGHNDARQATVAVSEPKMDWQIQDGPGLLQQESLVPVEQQSNWPKEQQPSLHAPADWQWQDCGTAQQQQQQSDSHVHPNWEEGSRGALPAADMQDVNMRLQQVRSCLRQGKQENIQTGMVDADPVAWPSGPATARGRRPVGDGGFAGMRLSQVMPARPPAGPRRHSDTHAQPPASQRQSEGGRLSSEVIRQQEGLDAWQGQGLDEVLRPVQTTRPVQPSRQPAGRQPAQALQGSTGAVRSTYAGYIQELQQSGASTGNRLALHASRRNTGSEAVEALLRHPAPPAAPQPAPRRTGQAPSASIMSLLRRVTYTAKASQLRPSNQHSGRESGDAQTECSICLENFALQEQLRRVGCGHLFHARCIQEWFATGDTRCPMCRFDPLTRSWPG